MPTEGLVDYIREHGYPAFVREFNRKLKTVDVDVLSDDEILQLYHRHSFLLGTSIASKAALHTG